MQPAIARPDPPLGRSKSVGPFGPKYEVGPPLRQRDDGGWMIEVTMVESGQKAEYKLADMHEDPDAS